jgi:hypothetical protein
VKRGTDVAARTRDRIAFQGESGAFGHVDEGPVRNALPHLEELAEFVPVLGCCPRSD